MTKKIGFICLALVLALAVVGIGYAHWWDTVYVDTTVKSGHFDIIFTQARSNDPLIDTTLDPREAGEWWLLDTLPCWGGYRWNKDVGSLEVTGAGTTALTVTLDKGYPGYYPSIGFTIDNPGTIPAKIESIKIDDVDYTCPVNMDFDGDGNVDVEIAITHIDVGQQIDPEDEKLGDLDLRIYQEAAMQASECVSGGFVVTIVTTQWNKVAAKTLSVPSPSPGPGTIQAAIDAANPGDTIYIAAGAYTENVVINKAVTLRGAGADVCTVTAASSTTHVFNVTADGVTICGFTITGTTDAAYGVNLEGVDDCCICSNDLLDNPIAIALAPGSDNNVIKNNHIPTTGDFGISLISSDYNTIKGNTVLCSWNPIWVDSSSHNLIVANTVIGGTGSFPSGSGYGSGGCIQLVANFGDCSDNTVRGNTCSNMIIGIKLGSGFTFQTRDNLVEGNICTGTNTAIRLRSDGAMVSGNIIRDNLLSDSTIGFFVWANTPVSAITVDGNNITSNAAGIKINAGVDPTAFTIVNNNIVGNTVYGVKNLGSGVLDAENNWWGSVNGPEDPDETVEVPPCTADPASEKNELPAGELGNMVVDDDTIVVDYCPWLTEPY